MAEPKYWIDAANKVGPLPPGATDFLECMLIPIDGKLTTLPADVWQGIWRLAHMAKALDEREQNTAAST